VDEKSIDGIQAKLRPSRSCTTGSSTIWRLSGEPCCGMPRPGRLPEAARDQQQPLRNAGVLQQRREGLKRCPLEVK